MVKSESFFEMVYEVVKLIPAGRVTSYGAIAAYLGMAKSARMVGWALNQSIKSNVEIPAHRVLNRNGLLTGKMHFKGESMQCLLEKEGIKVKDNAIAEWDKVFWDPREALKL